MGHPLRFPGREASRRPITCWTAWWSRPIDRRHRLVYRVVGDGDGQRVEVVQCRRGIEVRWPRRLPHPPAAALHVPTALLSSHSIHFSRKRASAIRDQRTTPRFKAGSVGPGSSPGRDDLRLIVARAPFDPWIARQPKNSLTGGCGMTSYQRNPSATLSKRSLRQMSIEPSDSWRMTLNGILRADLGVAQGKPTP